MTSLKRVTSIITIFFATTFGAKVLQAKEPPLPDSMAAIGDSITAGAIAQFTTESWYDPTHLIGLLYRLLRTRIVGSAEPAQRKDLSWATGANNQRWVHSHYTMLSYLAEQQGRGGVHVYNAAVSSEDSGDALRQLDKVVNWSVSTYGKGAPDYVTILVGANDLCNDGGEPSTPTGTYRTRISKLVHEVLVRNKNSKVMLVELPNINRAWELAGKKRLTQLENFKSCSDLWRRSNICQTVLSDLTPAQRKRSYNQNREYNRVLRETVANFAAQSNRYGRDRVRLAKGLFDHPLKFEEMSIDCFHPNYMGQSNIGWMTFSQSWWYPKLKPKIPDYTQWVKHVVKTRRYKAPYTAQPVDQKKPRGYTHKR